MLVTFYYSWVMDFSPMHHFQGDSFKDGFHCLWFHSSGDLAKYIGHSVVIPFLVF